MYRRVPTIHELQWGQILQSHLPLRCVGEAGAEEKASENVLHCDLELPPNSPQTSGQFSEQTSAIITEARSHDCTLHKKVKDARFTIHVTCAEPRPLGVSRDCELEARALKMHMATLQLRDASILPVNPGKSRILTKLMVTTCKWCWLKNK